MKRATILSPPSTGLRGILLSKEPEYDKISILYQCMGRSFTNSTQEQRQLL